MEQKLNKLYIECIEELNNIGIDILKEQHYGKIDVTLSKRNNKRYGCCKQEEPDKNYRTVTRVGRRRIIKFEKFNKHHIEISPWVMKLEDNIIKNTIMHELIHCIPYCNNHGIEFKKYANLINVNYGYDVSRVGNKKQDFENSKMVYDEKVNYKYKITCNGCSQEFYRQRLSKSFSRKYRCAKCGGKFEITILN